MSFIAVEGKCLSVLNMMYQSRMKYTKNSAVITIIIIIIISLSLVTEEDQDSSVGIATRYGLDDPGIESW